MPRGRTKKETIWDRRSAEENEYAVAVGKRIAQARHEAGGMTQRELADLLGVTERSVAAYEAGEVIPYRFNKELESLLEKPRGWFLHGDGGMDGHDGKYELLLEELKQLRADLAKKKLI